MYPFRITGSHIIGTKNFKYFIEEKKGPAWHIAFQNLKTSAGKYKNTLVLETDSSIMPELKIQVHGLIVKKDPATISKDRISLAGPADKTLLERIIIRSPRYSPFEIESITTGGSGNIKVWIEKKGRWKGDSFIITVENRRKTQGSYSEILRIKTSSIDQPEFKVGIIGDIHPPR